MFGETGQISTKNSRKISSGNSLISTKNSQISTKSSQITLKNNQIPPKNTQISCKNLLLIVNIEITSKSDANSLTMFLLLLLPTSGLFAHLDNCGFWYIISTRYSYFEVSGKPALSSRNTDK